MAYCCYVYKAWHAYIYIYIHIYVYIYIYTYIWYGTLHNDIKMFNFTWNYLIIIFIYYYHTYIMQISIYVMNNMPEPGRNLAADACMGRTQLSPCIYNFSMSTRTIRANRNAMSAWHFFYAEPFTSRFSSEIYITLLQQLWQKQYWCGICILYLYY